MVCTSVKRQLLHAEQTAAWWERNDYTYLGNQNAHLTRFTVTFTGTKATAPPRCACKYSEGSITGSFT